MSNQPRTQTDDAEPLWSKEGLADFKWSCTKIYKEHSGWLIFLALSLIALVIFVVINTKNEKKDNIVVAIISSIGINLFISFLAAGLIEIFAQLRKNMQVHREQRNFKNFFGINEAEKVAIVLPKFKTNDPDPFEVKLRDVWLSHPSQTHTSNRKKVADTEKAEELDLLDFAVLPDITAAAAIIATFSKVHLQPPPIIWDEQARHDFEEQTEEYDTYICIGIFSNSLLAWLNQQSHITYYHELKAPEIKGDLKKNFQLKLAVRKQDQIDQDRTKWATFPTDPSVEYGLISKVTTPRQKIIFTCGGLNAVGTPEMGEFIRDK